MISAREFRNVRNECWRHACFTPNSFERIHWLWLIGRLERCFMSAELSLELLARLDDKTANGRTLRVAMRWLVKRFTPA
jgi:hypothetical protein